VDYQIGEGSKMSKFVKYGRKIVAVGRNYRYHHLQVRHY